MLRVPRLPVRAWFLLAVIAGILPLTLPRAVYAKAPTPPALLAAPTTTNYVLNGTFTTTGQSMLGPGVAVTQNVKEDLFSFGWNESASIGDIETVSIDPCDPIPGVSCDIGGDFGAELTASTSGKMGMSVTFRGATSGTVSITYPVTIGLQITTEYPANGAKTITIESSISVDAGAKVVNVAPTYSSVSLDGEFGFHAGIGGRLCFFECFDLPAVNIDIPNSTPGSTATGTLLDIPANVFTDAPGFGLTSCFNVATNILIGAGPYYGGDGRCGYQGYIAYPNPKLTNLTGPNGVLTASGIDPYVIIPISSVAWAARIASLPPGTPNFGPFNYGDFGFGYTTVNQTFTGVLRQNQTFTFNPIVDLSLQLPRSMPYVVTDPGNTVVATNTSATVSFRAGHKVVITIPKEQTLPVTITPTLSIRNTGNNFRNQTNNVLSSFIDNRILELYLRHPGYEFEMDFGILGSVDVPIMPAMNFKLGPLYQQNTTFPDATLETYDNSWNMGGFSPIQLPSFQPPMLLLSDRGIRGQTDVQAIAPSRVTDIECVDSRGNLRVQGTDLDEASVRTLVYAGAGWHVITCTATTVSDGTFVGTFGIYVLSDPHRAASAPPPALDFGTPVGACNPRGFLLKNDTLKNFNLNSLNMAGTNAADFFILSGGDPSQMGPLQPGYGQVFALQYCKTGEGPRTANLILNGSLGTGAGAPAPVSIPLVGNGPNLTITKSQDRPTPVTNQTMTYTITARANGQAANGVELRDTLPSGLSNINASATAGFTCTPSGNVINCTGNLAANASVVITITATVTASAGTTLVNTAVVDPDGDIAETNENDNTAKSTAVVTAAPNLTITKSQSSALPLTGADLVYTIRATSNGGAASGVLVRDALPAGVQFKSVTTDQSFGCVLINTGNGVVACTGNLTAGATVEILITVTVTGTPGTVLSNAAVVDPLLTVTETNENDNTSATVTATIQNGLNLTLTKTQSTAAPGPNTNLVYTLKAKAVGGAVTGVVVRDTLPAGTQWLSVSNDGSFACPLPPVTPNVVNCTGNIASGQEVTFTITVLVTSQGSSLVNNAAIDPGFAFSETNEGDNTAQTTATVANPRNLTITKTRTSAATVAPNGNVTYQIVVTSVGAPTNNVQVRDILPGTLSFVSVTNTAADDLPTSFFGCGTPAGQQVDCAGNLAAGESVTITLTAKVVAGTADNTVITNTATVDPDNDIAENDESVANNSSSATVTVDIPS